ncbi:hypothetical protein ACFLRA_00240 [Bdellovibrionota bacterium]
MKRFCVAVSLYLALIAFPLTSSASLPADITMLSLQGIQYVINWNVGDYTVYDMEMMFGGEMRKEVTSLEDHALWLSQTMDFGFFQAESRIKIDRRTGEILEFWVNGEKQEIPETDVSLVKQEEDHITVPAGEFDVIKVTIKDNKTGKLSYIWINPVEVPMEGMVQMQGETELGEMVLKLREFGTGS